MDIVHIISKVKEQEILFNEGFKDNHRRWETVDNASERAEVINNCYFLENKTKDKWHYYDRPDVIDRRSDFILSVKYRVLSAGHLGNFGIVWGYEQDPKVLNRFVFNVRHEYCAAMRFNRNEAESHTIYRASKPVPMPPGFRKDVQTLSIIRMGGHYYFFAGNTHSPLMIEKETHFVLEGNSAGFYTEPGMKVEVIHFFSKRFRTEPVNEGTFSFLLSGSVVPEGGINNFAKPKATQPAQDPAPLAPDTDAVCAKLNRLFKDVLGAEDGHRLGPGQRELLGELHQCIKHLGIEFSCSQEHYAICSNEYFLKLMEKHKLLGQIQKEKDKVIRFQKFELAARLRSQEREVVEELNDLFRNIKELPDFFEKVSEKEIRIKLFPEPHMNELIRSMLPESDQGSHS